MDILRRYFYSSDLRAFLFSKERPELLERRMRMREKEEKQKTIIKIAFILFFIGFIIPGLDYRYHWSDVLWLLLLLQTP